MCCYERAPRSPALRCFANRLVRRKPGVGVSESEIRRWKGVGLPQPEGDVVRRPRAETVQGCERSHEAVERDAAVEAHSILDDGTGERADCFTTSRHETDARVVGAGKRRGRRERVREPQRLEPRHTSAEPLDESPADRVRRRDRHLLPDDRAHSQFKWAPRPRRAHARTLTDQPPDDPVGGQDADGLIDVEIEVRDVASPLHDVHELFPVGQMGPQQQMIVPTWAELEDTGRLTDHDRPPIRVSGDAFYAGDRAAGEVVEQRRPVEWAAVREPQDESAVRREPVCPAAPRS